MRLIDADKMRENLVWCKSQSSSYDDYWDDVIERLDAQPTVSGWVSVKGQEPRVLTLEDVKAFDWDYCYLEEERLPGKVYRDVCGDYALTCITWPCVTSMRIQHGDESYGRKWRCWNYKPTDKQRKAVKWG